MRVCVDVEKKRVFLNSNFYMIFPVPCNWKQINYAWQDAKLSSHLLPVKTNQLKKIWPLLMKAS